MLRKLSIGLIAYSSQITKDIIIPSLRDLEKRRQEKMASMSPDNLKIEDDTQYIMLYDIRKTRGLRIDQLLICDDSRWLIRDKQRKLINNAKTLLTRSCLPEEFRVLELEIF